MWNIKVVVAITQKIWSRLKFLRSRTNTKMKVTRSIFGTHENVLSQWILMWNIKVLVLTNQKLWPRLKSFGRWNDKGRNTYRRKTIYPSIFEAERTAALNTRNDLNSHICVVRFASELVLYGWKVFGSNTTEKNFIRYFNIKCIWFRCRFQNVQRNRFHMVFCLFCFLNTIYNWNTN
jgi:hypothetical protein